MKALWRRLVAFLAYLVPSDERLECDTPELRAFINSQQALKASRRQESHV